MYLVQIFLPLYNNAGKRFPKKLYGEVRNTLVARFGGLTVYSRAPASGLWEKKAGETIHDEMIIFEIMTKKLGASWWRKYRGSLEKRFEQDQVIVRAQTFQLL